MERNHYKPNMEVELQETNQLRALRDCETEDYPLPLRYECVRLTAFSICSLIILIIGIELHQHNNQIISQQFQYDSDCDIPSNAFNKTCSFTINVEEDMKKPVYLYYELTKFWQNHAMFIQSVSHDQLDETDLDNVEECGDKEYGTNGKIIVPCGVQSWSYFNDEIEMTVTQQSAGGCAASCLDLSNVALGVDKENRFAKFTIDPSKYSQSFNPITETENNQTTYIRGRVDLPDFDNVDNQGLMVWMRFAATSSFKKLHSVIDFDLNKGDILTFTINSKLRIPGEKSLVLSTMNSPFGGKHEVLANVFISFGVIMTCFMIGIFAVHCYLSQKYMGRFLNY